jgi:tRNA threonylcarbamoyladenosine biosynthesis protein TsaE
MFLRTNSVSDTRLLAANVARLAREGDVVLLVGDLGAGKTAFAQGFGLGLGVAEAITSPTFTLVREYMARLRLHHIDVYRLNRMQEVLDLGLSELLDDGGVTLIEWGDAVRPALRADYLEVRLAFVVDDDHRDIEIVPVGPSWSARVGDLGRTLSYWTLDPGA